MNSARRGDPSSNLDQREDFLASEVMDYSDDVTPEGNEKLRRKAEKAIGDRSRWKQIDGFGRVISA